MFCRSVVRLRAGRPFLSSLISLSTIQRNLSRDVVCLALGIYACLASCGRAIAAPGDADPTFTANLSTNEDPKSIVEQRDGKIVVANDSTLNTRRIIRFNPDGSIDTAFDAAWFASPRAPLIANAPEGKLFAAPFPTRASGLGAIVRLSIDGNLDSTFQAELASDEVVGSMVVDLDGKLLVYAKIVSSSNTVLSERIVRLNTDGGLDQGFKPVKPAGYSSIQLAILADGRVVAFGGVASIDGIAIPSLARLNADGSLDTLFLIRGATATGPTFVLINSVTPSNDGKLLIAGDFKLVDGQSRINVAKLNSDGSLDPTFDAGPIDGSVKFVAEQRDGKIIIAGDFRQVQGASRRFIARLNADGSLDGDFVLNLPLFTLSGVAVTRIDEVVVGGRLTTSSNGTQNFLARLKGGTSLAGPPMLLASPQSHVKKVGENVSFEVLTCGTPTARYQWLFNDQTMEGQTNAFLTLRSLDYRHTGSYAAVASNNLGTVLTSPAHLVVNATPITAGSVDLTFNSNNALIGIVWTIGLQSDKVIVGGRFRFENVAGGNIARLNPDGTRDVTFQATGTTSDVLGLVVDPQGRIYVAGRFTRFNGASRRNLVRLKPDGSMDDSFDPPALTSGNASIETIFLQPDGKLLVAGCLDSSACERTIVRLTPEGILDPQWRALNLSMQAYDIAVQKTGRILLAGKTVGNLAHGTVLRLMPDGESDSSFPPFAASQDILKLLLLSDDRVIAGLRFLRLSSLGPF